MQAYANAAPRPAVCRRLVWACVVAGSLLLPPLHAADAGRANWSPARPPAGYSPDAYSPDKVKPDFAPDADPARGIDAYNPYTDPLHPTKNPDIDPGAGWDFDPAKPPADQSPGVRTSRTDWDWGERYFDAEFDATLLITNNCKSPQPVTVFVYDLPYLSLPNRLVVPPGQTPVVGKVKLPPEPPPPLRLGLPGEPGWGHVDFGKILGPNPVLPFPPPKLHQPNFVPIAGRVVTWHPWAPASGDDCHAKRQTYEVSGHIHFRPPPPPGGGGPEKILAPGPCAVYWNIGVPPTQLGDLDCTAEMRMLATHFRERVLVPYVLNAPDEWLWLPAVTALQGMAIPELLDMKARASALMGVPY